MKSTFIKVGFSVLMASVLLTGCGSRQNSFLETSTKVKIPSGLTNQEVFTIFDIMKIPTKYEHTESYLFNSYVSSAKYEYEFSITPEGNLLVKFNEDCGQSYCSNLENRSNVVKFKKEVNEKKAFLEKNLTQNLNEYLQSKNEILNWIDTVNKINLQINFETKITFNEDYLREFNKQKNVQYTKVSYSTPESIYYDFKRSGNPSLTSFLNKRSFAYTETNRFYYKNVKVEFPTYLDLTNYKEILVTKNPYIYSTFYPDKFFIENKDIKLELTNTENKGFAFKITNLTGNYIDISTVSLYVDSKINSVQFNVKLPPYSFIDGVNYLRMPPLFNNYILVESSDQKRNLGAAVSYKINNITRTLFDEKKFSYQY